jgi:hypothetical protein
VTHAGEYPGALELARRALEHAAAWGDPNTEASMWLVLAEVQRAAGMGAEADSAVERANELYEQNGNVAALARLRARSVPA